MRNKHSVIIIDDHPLVREGLKSVVNRHPLLEVVREADNVEEGYDLVREVKPDLVLLDIILHGSSGLELGKKLLAADPSQKIILLTMYSKIQYIVSALESGIRGYILKETSPAALLQGIEKVLEGEIFVDSYISNKVISQLIHREEVDAGIDHGGSYESLSRREQEILRLLVNGASLKQIANELFISAKTVENHKASIMLKLRCGNMVELVRFAIEIGLIEVPGS